MSVVVACFTVKHELVSWLKRQDDSSLESCHVVRYSDGARRFPQFVDSARGVRDS